ncbi:sugar ABC transporter ATP-binding protein [Rhizobium sp. NZLR3b]|uniref:ATP-binding cassette domain-containing protein n=1 Tax=Rhizobium sp. NZLR3b TaxID=2731101 RepID=UPI001C82D52B|nr:ATP-binding cassette domain-containing protein [Rhizobium sp. NZLR3b]MBX5193661.1 sugar ABC transporter ATP-binding protein [Rhizobium sp. NZLR3b]
MTDEIVLEVRGAVKSYGFVTALGSVDLTLKRGEILALLGDNGAGKTSLVRAISGIMRLDEGDILLEGQKLSLGSAGDARRAGIETVFQNLAVLDNLDVSSNFYIGRERTWPRWLGTLGFLNAAREESGWTQQAKNLGIKALDPRQEIGLMSGGQRQAVAVARAVAFASKVVILDEPTAALGVRESAQVLRLIKSLPERGVSVILISHNMEHVVQVADRAVVLRQGQVAGSLVPKADSVPDLIAMIMGAARPPN